MSHPTGAAGDRDRDAERRPRSARPRDGLGRPLPHGAQGIDRQAEGQYQSAALTLASAQRLFAAGMPFHAHEVFEEAWKGGPAADRELWRGLAQLAVGVTHAARGNRRGALSLLRRAATTIAPYGPAAPINVAAVLSWLEQSVARVEAECPVLLVDPPLAARGRPKT